MKAGDDEADSAEARAGAGAGERLRRLFQESEEIIDALATRPSPMASRITSLLRRLLASAPRPPPRAPLAAANPKLKEMLDLLAHASTCRSGSCQYLLCRRVKGLFRHGMYCRTRASGGCHRCKIIWQMIHLHARACGDSGRCNVPRCRDVKGHALKLQLKLDSGK